MQTTRCGVGVGVVLPPRDAFAFSARRARSPGGDDAREEMPSANGERNPGEGGRTSVLMERSRM
jgi:hypothetical protein